MKYMDYRKIIKKLDITSSKFTKIIGVSENTPSSNWKQRNEIPEPVTVILELLSKMPEHERVLYIYDKLKAKTNQ
jgi:DNA-binding transcriptional regulator YiaG